MSATTAAFAAAVGTLDAVGGNMFQPLTPEQVAKLQKLCNDYKVPYDQNHYLPSFDLPVGWVSGWVGGPFYDGTHNGCKRTLFVGVSPEGDSHS